MADGLGLYGDSGGGGGGFGLYGGSSGGGAPVGARVVGVGKKKGRHGVIGFVENLGEGAGKALYGAGAGLPTLAEAVGEEALKHLTFEYVRHPHTKSPLYEKIAKPAAKAEAEYYSPLIHGHFGEFGHKFYSDPVTGLLDLGAIATGGVSLTAKTGEALAKAGKISETGRLARFGRPGEITLRSPAAQAGEAGGEAITRRVGSGKPLVRIRKEAVHKGLTALPADTPLLGESSRFARAAKREAFKKSLRESQSREHADYVKATKNATPEEMAAANMIARAVHPAHYAAVLRRDAKRGETVRPQTLTLLRNPEVQKLYEHPTPKVQRIVDTGRALSERGTELNVAHGFLTRAAAKASPYRHAAGLYAGGRVEQYVEPASLVRERGRVARLQKRHEQALAQTQKLEFTGAQRKRLGDLGAPDDSAIALRQALRPMEKELRRLKALHDAPAANLLAQRAAMNRVLRVGNVASKAVDKFAEAAGTERGVHGLEDLKAQIDDMTTRIEETRGLEPDALTELRKNVQNIRRQIRAAEKPRSIVMEGPKPYVARAKGGVEHPIGSERAQRVGAALSVAKDRLQAAEKRAAAQAAAMQARATVHEARTAELQQKLGGTPREPYHVPDVALAEKPRTVQAQGRGRAAPRSPVHRSGLVNFHMGQLQLGRDVLSSGFLNKVRAAHADDVHQTLLRSAVPHAKGAPLPEGYTYVRRRVGKGSEKIPHTEKTLGEFERSMDSFATKHGEGTSDLAERDGQRLIVPERFVREMTGEFTRSSSVLRKVLAPPFAVWRALVLGFRPAFLVNNVVGNHLLYALKHGGYNGIRAYLDAVKRENGESAILGLIRDKAVPPALHDRLMRDYFPEQVYGTFGGTQTQVGGKIGRGARKIGGGVIPATQAVAESQLRRATVLKLLRTNKEVRRIYQEMPKQTRDLEAAYRQALDADPKLAHEISEQVDDTLGSYLNMSNFEKDAVRTLAPFYPWYRAILRITRTLVLDQPVRAALLQKLALVGADIANDKLGPMPAEFQGLFPQGEPQDGYQQVLTTGGFNPFQTTAQLGRAAASALGGAPGSAARDVSGLINPFITGAIQSATGRNLYTGVPLKGGVLRRGLIGGTLSEVSQGLPETRLVEAALGTGPYARGAKPGLYKRNLRTELLAAAGYPQKQVNLGLLHSLAQR